MANPNPTQATRFKKGLSGNPGGRKKEKIVIDGKTVSIVDLAREHTQEAITTLAEICKDKRAPAAARVTAASAILDRGFGRPKQDIDALVKVSHEQWLDQLLGFTGSEDAAPTSH